MIMKLLPLFLLPIVVHAADAGPTARAPLPTPERFPKLAADLQSIGVAWPPESRFTPFYQARIRATTRDDTQAKGFLTVDLHAEWAQDNATQYFPAVLALRMPMTEANPTPAEYESWFATRFIMVNRMPSDDWLQYRRKGRSLSLYNNQDIYLKMLSPQLFCEDMPRFRKEEKPAVIRDLLKKKIKLGALILRDLREEFKPDYAKRFPGQSGSYRRNGVGGSKEEAERIYDEEEKLHQKGRVDTIMRERHFMISNAIRMGEASLCVGLRKSFSGDAKTIREILECAGYKTAKDRADYWNRMKASGGYCQWSEGDEDRLTREPDEVSPPAK